MFNRIKKSLYFPLAYYFYIFAKIRLSIWRPLIVVITGSSGKTTTLGLVEAQIGNKAKYSHNANSSYGIPFDILNIRRKTLKIYEWPVIFLSAPFLAFNRSFKEKIYIVEADCDRPYEGTFLGSLLNPDITIWLNVSNTHSANFEDPVLTSNDVSTKIVKEFGEIARLTKKLVIYNADDSQISTYCRGLNLDKIAIDLSKHKTAEYQVSKVSTMFSFGSIKYKFNFLLPQATFYSLLAIRSLLDYLNLSEDKSYLKFKLPPGRSSMFTGINDSVIIDSTYNSNYDSMGQVLMMFDKIRSTKKVIVIGDMIELGGLEKKEHIKLANLLQGIRFDKLVLIGPRCKKYIHPLFPRSKSYLKARDAYLYLYKNIRNSTVLFKGSGFLEGLVEKMLLNKQDAERLVRRESVWLNRRGMFN